MSDKVLLQAYVTPELKQAIRRMAVDTEATLSELTQRVFSAAIKEHESKAARMAAVAGYSGEAPL